MGGVDLGIWRSCFLLPGKMSALFVDSSAQGPVVKKDPFRNGPKNSPF